MSLATQAKMLRVLQEKCFTRLGGIETVRSNCRIVAATNRDIEAAIRAGTFREELYYRLAVVEMRVPPLRERAGDILPLADPLPPPVRGGIRPPGAAPCRRR